MQFYCLLSFINIFFKISCRTVAFLGNIFYEKAAAGSSSKLLLIFFKFIWGGGTTELQLFQEKNKHILNFVGEKTSNRSLILFYS